MAACIVLIVILILYAALAIFMFQMIFARDANLSLMPKPSDPAALSPWDKYADTIKAGLDWFYAQRVDEVFITSRDGLKLYARYLPCPGSDRAILLSHGYRSLCAEHDFACALKLYHEMGFNILLIDERAQGKSEGKYITLGAMERLDIADWARFLAERYRPRHIILDGMSMGAAAVLMATGQKLPDSVRGVVADSGFTTPEAILAYVMVSDFHLPARLLLPGLRLLFRLKTGHSLREASAPKALSQSALPVLFIHGEDDKYVPCDMGRENARACPHATLVTVPGAGHGVSFLVDREKCVRALNSFIESTIGKQDRVAK